MKGAAEGLGIIICGSNLFAIKGMRGVRKCHLFWGWEHRFEVFFFFLPFSSALPIVRSSGNCVEVPAPSFLRWASVCEAASTVLIQGLQCVWEVPALFSGAAALWALQITTGFSASPAAKKGKRFTCNLEFGPKSIWQCPEPLSSGSVLSVLCLTVLGFVCFGNSHP